MSGEESKVTVEVNDPAADLIAARRDEAARVAAEARAAHAGALRNELGYLERQPKPNHARIALVKAELDRYASEPQTRSLETAASVVVSEHGPEVVVPPAGAPDEPPAPADPAAPAKKAAAAKRAAARKAAAAKKTAAKK